MKLYKITKIDSITEKEWDMGTWGYDDMKLITRGYVFNGCFYDRKGSRYFYIVEEV